MATGVHQHTGQIVDGIAELTQRMQRCFKTRVGTLPLHPDYGSNLPNRVDDKMLPGVFDVDVYADVADALANPANGFTDEFKLHRASLIYQSHATIELTLVGELLLNGESITIEGLSINAPDKSGAAPWQSI